MLLFFIPLFTQFYPLSRPPCLPLAADNCLTPSLARIHNTVSKASLRNFSYMEAITHHYLRIFQYPAARYRYLHFFSSKRFFCLRTVPRRQTAQSQTLEERVPCTTLSGTITANHFLCIPSSQSTIMLSNLYSLKHRLARGK